MTNKEKINEIMEWFNFSRVHKMMAAMNWTWGDKSVPSIEDLRNTALKLLNELPENGEGRIATGGFDARIDCGGHMELLFVYEEWDVTNRAD